MSAKSTQLPKNNIDPMVEFPKVENMLHKWAWKIHEQYQVPFEEARSQAYWAFMCACRKYNPNRGSSFSSYVYFLCWCQLKRMVMERCEDPLIPMELDDDLTGAAPTVHSESLELIEDLSADAKEIVNLITETPHDLLGGVPATARQLMTKVKLYMVKKRGRTEKQVNAAHAELRIRLQESWA